MRFCEYIDEHGMSIREFYRRSGVPISTLSRLYHGKMKSMTNKTVRKIILASKNEITFNDLCKDMAEVILPKAIPRPRKRGGQ